MFFFTKLDTGKHFRDKASTEGGFQMDDYQQKSPRFHILSSYNWGRVGEALRTSSSSSFFYQLAVAKFDAMHAALLFVLLTTELCFAY